MSRNRMIKSDFWGDEKIGTLSHIARLLFIGSWNFADDAGICRGNPAFLKSNIFPYDDITIQDVKNALDECISANLLKAIENNGEIYVKIENFLKHQTINRPSKFRYLKGNFTEDSMSTHGVFNDGSLMKEKEKVKEKVNTRKSNDIPEVCYEISDLIKKHCQNNKRVYRGNRDKSADIIRLMGTQDNLDYEQIKQEFTKYMQLYTGGRYDPEIFSCRSLREKWNSLLRFNDRSLFQEETAPAVDEAQERQREIDERYNRQMAAFEEACKR